MSLHGAELNAGGRSRRTKLRRSAWIGGGALGSIVLLLVGTFLAYGAGAGYFSALVPAPFSIVVAGFLEGGVFWVVTRLLGWAVRRSIGAKATSAL